ncbi:MAG: GDP-mannose transporter into the lumen of the Golgi [Chaenotheca gracillima]|nr:MAG: GDP-mannose transporter into the lumen of the Golgi [Chaenotheca gracillima]
MYALSFTQGFLLGQLSIVVIIGAFIKFFIFGEPPSADAAAARRASARRQQRAASIAQRQHELQSESPGPVSPPSSPSKSQQQQQRTVRRQRSSILRNPPPSTSAAILSKTYYNVESHQPESLDWFNVLIAQTIAQFRRDAQRDDAILASLNSVLNGPNKPDFLDDITVTELSLGEDFPILSNCKITPVENDGDGIGGKGGEGGRLQARMDVDLSDSLTLGLETKLILNYPKPLVAVLPVALTVSVVRFSGTLSISFIPSSTPASSPTTLAFSFMDDYRLELSVHSLVGSRSRLQDVPKIAQLVEARLHSWFDERCVEPRFQQIVLPSLWPRKQNTRGGSGVGGDGHGKSGSDSVRDLRAEAMMELEAELKADRAKVASFFGGNGMRQRRRDAGSEGNFVMPGTMPGMSP